MSAVAAARVSVAASPETRPQRCTVEMMAGEAVETALPRAEWDALLHAALEDNPFLSRQFVLASFRAFGGVGDTRFLVIRSEDGALAGLVPFRVRSLPFREARIALDIYQVHGVPLIARAHAEAAVRALAGFVASAPGVPRRFLFPHIDSSGPFAALLGHAAAAHGFEAHFVRRYRRPALVRIDGGYTAHLRKIIGKRRRKDMERNLRRLSELGEVRYEHATEPDLVRRRVEAFLAMEHAGWKGARGTSFLARADHALHARLSYCGGLGPDGLTSVDSLLLDGTPVAAIVNIAAGRTVFSAKCAYDETYARCSPGLILEHMIIEAFYEDPRFDEVDAATTVDGHMIGRLWTRQKPMGMLILGPRGWRTRLRAAAEDVHYRARNAAKRLLRRM